MGLLAALVWAIKPSKSGLKPAPLRAVTAGPDCAKLAREFVPSNITDLPGASLAGLTDEQKDRARFHLNMEPCSCGCNLSIIACRNDNPRCATSDRLSQKVIVEERGQAESSEKP